MGRESGVFRRGPLEEGQTELARPDAAQLAGDAPCLFSNRLKSLRHRLIGKQAALALGVGCTEAAVSYWETGRRLPSRSMVARIIETLRTNGCEAPVLDELLRQWLAEKVIGRETTEVLPFASGERG